MNLHQRKLDPERKRRIEALLQDEPELREQLLPTETTPLDRALRVLSLVRSFDRSMYDDVCRRYDDLLPDFEEIIRSPDIQVVPRTEDRFWLRDVVQEQGAAYWDEHRDEMEVWASRFFDWLDRHDGLRTERLALLLRFDPARALRFLANAFEEADAKDDLIVCHALTQQVESKLQKIDPDLRPEFSEFVARYRGRAWFLREFHRTVKYFPRPLVESAFKQVIEGDGARWILYLSSPGGMGKTMFVQRMIAHELLKNRPFPLVARLDLDDIQVPEMAKVPWLVAIEIAEELDEQLVRRLFSEGSNYLSNVKTFSALLYRRESDRGRTVTDDERYALRNRASEQFAHWDGFKSRCMELPQDRPLVIFIDTIEEATLHWPVEFRGVLTRFEELRRDLPQLRLILSGRYPPSDETTHFVQYDAQLRKQTRFVQLVPLDSPDAEKFIRCQLPDVDEQLMEVMVSAAAGNPFKLGMLCEIVSQNPGMDAEKLKEYGPDVEVVYLIQRVIERIPVADELGLRWVLRYGSIPRRLTFSFLQEVLHPLLIKALRGEIEEAKEDVPSAKERQAWLKNADAALDPERLWEKLSKYASEHSWISLESKDPYTATLHPDVLTPMRGLLKQQPIFHRLHREAVDHFVKLKAQNPDRWVELTLAELYHRVQLAEDGLHEALLKALDERPSPDAVTLRLEVLREIVKPGGDFTGAPAAMLARAHYEIADATAIEANFDYLPRDTRREDIRRSLDKAFELNRSADVQLPSFAFKWRDFLDRNIPNKWSAVSDLLLVTKSDESRTRYWLLVVEMLALGRFPPQVFAGLARISGMSEQRVVSKRIPAWVVLERAANAYITLGSYRTAEKYLRDILRTWKEPPESKHFARIQTRLIGLLVKGVRLGDAEEEIQKADAATNERDQDRLLLRIEMCLLRRDAWTALAMLEKLQDKQGYCYHQLRGQALGQLLRIDEAVNAFREAKQAGLNGGTPTQLDEIRRDELMFRLFEAGLSTEPDNPRPSAVGAAVDLELIRAYQVRDNRSVCESIIRAQLSDRYPESIRIRATLAGVSWGILPSSAIDESFISMLGRVDGAGTRLLLLQPPVLHGQAQPWQLGWFMRWKLRSDLGPQGNIGAGMMEWVLFGRALLAMGDRKGANAAFAHVNVGPDAKAAELAVFRQRCLGDPQASPQPVGFWAGLESEPGLYAEALVENAERALRNTQWAIAETSLARAAEVLQAGSIHPILTERHRAVQGAWQRAAQADGAAARTAPAESPADDSAASLADYRCAMLAVDAERISIEPAGQDRQLLSTSENESMRILSAYSRERSPRRLAPYFLQSWPAPIDELHEPLAALLQPPSRKDETVLLALAGAPLVAVPWEVAVPPSFAPVRIGNGRHQGPVPDEIRRPAEIRQGAKSLSSLARRSRSGTRIGVYRVKYSPGPDMISQMSVLDNRLLASHLFAGADSPSPDVIYVMSDVEESPSLPEPSLPGGMTAEMLGREFQRGGGDAFRPFAVLHSPMPQSMSSALEQLFARNRFAQALVNSGTVSGVLATGIRSSPKDPERQDLLLEALRTANTWVDVMRTVRASSVYPAAAGSLEEMLGLPATALFLSLDSGPL